MDKLVKKQYQCGIQAGVILRMVRYIENSGENGSINKAAYVIERHYSEGAKEAAHHKTHQKGIISLWKEFKTVAHLWAGLIEWFSLKVKNKDANGVLASKNISLFEHVMSDRNEILNFLAYAESYRSFGESHYSKTRDNSEPTLLPNDTWSVPEKIELPPISLEISDLNENFKSYLNSYSQYVRENKYTPAYLLY